MPHKKGMAAYKGTRTQYAKMTEKEMKKSEKSMKDMKMDMKMMKKKK